MCKLNEQHVFSYELRDDRRKEIVRSSSHIDAVKRDIMRTMSTSTRAFVPTPRMRTRTSMAEEELEQELAVFHDKPRLNRLWQI